MKWLRRIFKACHVPHRIFIAKEDHVSVSVNLKDNEQQLLHIVVKDKKNIVDSVTEATWAVDDPTIATATVQDPLGRSALIVAGKPGSTNAKVMAGPITITVPIVIGPSDDAEIDVTADPVQTQPDASTPSPSTAPTSTPAQ